MVALKSVEQEPSDDVRIAEKAAAGRLLPEVLKEGGKLNFVVVIVGDDRKVQPSHTTKSREKLDLASGRLAPGAVVRWRAALTRSGHAPPDTLDGFAAIRNSGPRISLRNYKVPDGKLNVTVGKRSPILNSCQRVVFGRLLDISRRAASDGSVIAARGSLA